jgi:hypothetical protein
MDNGAYYDLNRSWRRQIRESMLDAQSRHLRVTQSVGPDITTRESFYRTQWHAGTQISYRIYEFF